MGISNYSDLVSAIIEYLAREEDATLIARIPTFIQLTEAKMNRELFTRQMENRATTVIDITTSEAEFITLPDDFQSMRRVRLSDAEGKPQLDFLSGTQMDQMRLFNANISGRPRYFTIFGTEMELFPTPASDCTIEMVYRATIPPLTDANPMNWVLTLAPDLYLYGALLETAPYIKEDGRIQTWGAGFSSAMDGLNNLGMASTFNAGPLQVRISGQAF